MGYIHASTENPLGRRPFNAQLTQSVIPSHGYSLSGYRPLRAVQPRGAGLGAYFPANYYVPTPLNVSLCPTANILEPGMGFLGEFINNVPYLRPGQWRSRDDAYSPLPRIYIPPELANRGLSFLGANDWNIGGGTVRVHPQPPLQSGGSGLFDWIRAWLFRRHPQFSGGVRATDAANPSGFFFPRTPAAPYAFPIHAAPIWGPNPASPGGLYFPRTPQQVVPAWMRAQDVDWTGLGATIAQRAGTFVSPFKSAPVLKATPVTSSVTPKPPLTISSPSSSGGFLRSTPPVTLGPPVSPSGVPIPVITPGTAATLPSNVISAQGGICTVESSPETGSVVSSVPCNTLPGYSAGTAPTVSTAIVPISGGSAWGLPTLPQSTIAATTRAQQAGYNAAIATIQSGGALTAAQLASFTPAQQAALNSLAAQYGAGVGSSFASMPAATQTALLAAGVTATQFNSLTATQQQTLLQQYGAGTLGTAGLSTSWGNLSAAQQSVLTAAGITAATWVTMTPTQQQQILAQVNSTAAAQQAAAIQSAGAGGGGGAMPSNGGGGGAPDQAADILGWLSQSSLITGVPNWVIAGGAGLLVLYLMKKK
jgi:hypothetical protein